MQRFATKIKPYLSRGFLLIFFLLVLVHGSCDVNAATLKEKSKPKDITASAKGEYHKLVVKKSSFIGVSAFGNSKATKKKTIRVVCLNSKKKVISPIYVTNVKKAAYFTLKPGTYYLKVKSSAPSYRISAAFHHVSDRAGSSKKKARTIKPGKEAYGILYHTDSIREQHWYKFKLTKPQKVKLSIKKAGGRIGFAISGPETAAKQITRLKKMKTVILPAGTYYITFQKPDQKAAKDGAVYSIRLK